MPPLVLCHPLMIDPWPAVLDPVLLGDAAVILGPTDPAADPVLLGDAAVILGPADPAADPVLLGDAAAIPGPEDPPPRIHAQTAVTAATAAGRQAPG